MRLASGADALAARQRLVRDREPLNASSDAYLLAVRNSASASACGICKRTAKEWMNLTPGLLTATCRWD